MAKSVLFPFLGLGFFCVRSNAYPTSVMLTTDVAFADILADIPFFSVSLFALGAFTFFFVMKRMSILTTCITLAVASAFLGAIFDISQIYRRGYWNTMNNLDLSSVRIYADFREVFFAISIALRYLSIWLFVAEPPRRERPLIPIPEDRRANFMTLDSQTELHSGSWKRFGYLGIFIQWKMFAAIIAVLVLQLLWRLVTKFHSFGSIYFAEEGLQIALSVAFILKLSVNAIISPLTPRWKTLRDYSPMILAILLGMGVAIGNIACFAFSESTIGRLIQTTELYVLVLFVLITAFYKIPLQSSMVDELVRRRLIASGYRDVEPNPDGIEVGFSMIQTTDPLSSDNFLRGRSDQTQANEAARPNIIQRISNSSVFGQRFMNMRSPLQTRTASPMEGDQTRLWDKNGVNVEPSPAGQASFRLSLEQSPFQTPTAETKEAPGWTDPVFTSVIKEELRDVPVASSSADKDLEKVDPQANTEPDDASVYTTDIATLRIERDSLQPPLPRETTDSPIYGLNGIIQNLKLDTLKRMSEVDITSTRSSVEDIDRQRGKLDQSMAGLMAFSPKMGSSRAISESVQSDISLSNFPNPPFSDVLGSENDGKNKTFPGATNSMAFSALSDNSLMVDDIQFQLVPPPVLPAALAEAPERGRNLSVPSIARESLDSALEGSGRAARMDSQGTQYDVTSFIGGLTVPGGSRSPLSDIAERERATESDAGSVAPETSPERQPSGNDGDGSDQPSTSDELELGSPRNPDDQQPKRRSFLLSKRPLSQPPSEPLPTTPPTTNTTILQAQQRAGPFLRPLFLPAGAGRGVGRGRGLPTGPRGRLEISNPMPIRSSKMLSERSAFQRPRPAPLVIQDSNLSQPSPQADAPKDGWYF